MELILFFIKFVGGGLMIAGEWLACVTWKDITTELPWKKQHTISYGLMVIGAMLILSTL